MDISCEPTMVKIGPACSTVVKKQNELEAVTKKKGKEKA